MFAWECRFQQETLYRDVSCQKTQRSRLDNLCFFGAALKVAASFLCQNLLVCSEFFVVTTFYFRHHPASTCFVFIRAHPFGCTRLPPHQPRSQSQSTY